MFLLLDQNITNLLTVQGITQQFSEKNTREMLPPCCLTKLHIKLYNCGKTECLGQVHCCLRTSDEYPEQTLLPWQQENNS